MSQIILRHLKEIDYLAIKNFVTDPEVSKHLTWQPYTNEADIKKYFDTSLTKTNFPDEVLAITMNGEVIGTIHIILRDNAYAQLGFNIFLKYQQDPGLAVSIMKEIIKVMQSRWLRHNIKEVWLDFHKDNKFMRTVADYFKFKERDKNVGKDRKHFYMQTEFLYE